MPLDNLENTDNSIQTLMDVIEALELSPGSQAQLTSFVKGLSERSMPQFQSFLMYVIQFVEYNSSKYLQLQIDLNQILQELQTL